MSQEPDNLISEQFDDGNLTIAKIARGDKLARKKHTMESSRIQSLRVGVTTSGSESKDASSDG